MLDEYISKGISSRIVIMENDSSKHKGYRADLVENKDENNLFSAIGAADINKLGILSSCIYTNVNESRQNLYLKLISAIHNLSDDNAVDDHNNNPKPVISYNLYSDRKPLNDWDNPNRFPYYISLWRQRLYYSLIYQSFFPCMGQMGFVTSF